MPRVPRYVLHKPSGRATIQYKPFWGKKKHYLAGQYNSPESLAEYEEWRAKILAHMAAESSGTPPPARGTASVHEMLLAWKKAAVLHYGSDKDREFRHMLNAALRVDEMHGDKKLRDFGPIALKEVRTGMVKAGHARSHINRQIGRIKRIFRWGVEEEWIDADTLANLQAVAGLRKGKTAAKELPPVAPVPWSAIEPLLPWLTPVVAAMVETQFLTGMRSIELTGMRRKDVAMGGPVWLYSPVDHKTAWRGKMKIICLGPKAQALLRPYVPEDPEGYFFSPAIALRQIAESKAARRKNKPYGKRRTPKVRTDIQPKYSTSGYQHAVNYGFAKWAMHVLRERHGKGYRRPKGMKLKELLELAGISYFHPHRSRHARATETRAVYGLEGAQAQTGNTLEAAQLYAEKSVELAMRIALETG